MTTKQTEQDKLRWTLMRRSGVAVCLMLETLGWRPKHVYHVGVGQNNQELDVMQAVWGEDGFTLEGFEPHPVVAAALAKTYPGTLHQVALSNEIGIRTLYAKQRHKDGSSLFAFPEDYNTTAYQVRVSTLDAMYPNGPGNAALLWVDTEGNELNVLRGGDNFLTGVDVVNLEMTGRPPCQNWCGTLELHQLMLGFGFYRLWVHTSRFTAGQYDALYVRRPLFRPELCCCPCAIEQFEKGNS
jgi:FkbM family methyltransferase